MFKFKLIIRKIIYVFASREFAFVYCLLGTFALISHVYFLVYEVSSFTGIFRILQAILLSFFISSSLLYFVSVADKNDAQEYKRIIKAVNIFVFIEILINIYYYAQNLLLNDKFEIFNFIFGVLVSCFIPFTIKLYANSIKAKEWLDIFDENGNKNVSEKITDYNQDEIVKILQSKVDDMISNDLLKTIYKIVDEKVEIMTQQINIKNQPSIDDDLFKQKLIALSRHILKDELSHIVNGQISVIISEQMTKNLDIVELENRYINLIMEKIEQITHEKNNEFLKNIEEKIQKAITEYKSKK